MNKKKCILVSVEIITGLAFIITSSCEKDKDETVVPSIPLTVILTPDLSN